MSCPRRLSESHRNSLVSASGISQEIVSEMAVWTASSKQDLTDIGFPQKDLLPPALVFPIFTWSHQESPLFHRIRPDSPRSKEPGKPKKYEQPYKQECRIYCLPTARKLIENLQGDSSQPSPALPYVFVTEGEKKAAALVSKRLAGLSLAGVWNFRSTSAMNEDWSQICTKGLQFCIVFDSDAITNDNVRKAEACLIKMLQDMGANVSICRLQSGPKGEKTGIDDYFARGGTVAQLASLISDAPMGDAPIIVPSKDDLIRLALAKIRLWHDEKAEGHATIPSPNGGFENVKIRGRSFRTWLDRKWFSNYRSAAPREALERAIDTLEGFAIHESESFPTAIRVGHTESTVWLDLNNETKQVIRVTQDGWDFVEDQDCPLRFLRTGSMEKLPQPSRDGSFSGLGQLLSIDADGLLLVEAYLLASFMPLPGGIPILAVTGEQGSGKSFGCRVIRSILDPSRLALRSAPKTENDLGAGLSSSYVLGFDNLSFIPGWLSDALCILTTGGGLAKRRLYTDAEEHILYGRRPVLLNGINDSVSAPDLAERSLFIEFKRPSDALRRTEKELEHLLNRESGRILGELLNRVSRALANQSITCPGSLPRLADAAKWVYAGSPPETREKTWRALAENRKGKNLAIIEADILASALQDLAARQTFTGTARRLLEALCLQEKIDAKNRPEGWPRSADALGKRISRLAPVLREAGLTVHHQRGKERIWTIGKKETLEVSEVSEASDDSTFELEVEQYLSDPDDVIDDPSETT